MSYPNAVKGLKLCIIGEVIDLIAAICIAVAYVISGTVIENTNLATGDTNLIFTDGIILLVALAMGFLSMASLIVKLIGSYKAAKDEYSFRGAVYGLSLGILTTVIGVLFADNTLVSGSSSLFGEIADMFALCMVVQGIRHLAIVSKLDDIERRGSLVIKLILIPYIITTILRMIMILSDKPGMFSNISHVLIVVINIAVFVIYISYIVISRNCLKSDRISEAESLLNDPVLEEKNTHEVR